ncbi:MAG: CinA family protein [Gammaproteobacteria bacterium]|nr:CinA family protein [Gammaproteobacteria bacterium]
MGASTSSRRTTSSAGERTAAGRAARGGTGRAPVTAVADDRQLRQLAGRVARLAIRRGWSIATAESCTGGWVAKALTDVPGSSAWFVEGFVTYGNAAKRRRLGVRRSTLEQDGAVSEAVVRQMVRGALRRSGADRAVAVSGIAGPSGAVPGKPVGTVWICWGLRQRGGPQLAAGCYRFAGGREAVRRQSVAAALRGLYQA